jgi:glycosyltransferase involved in cell wall biosynthesis
VGAYSVDLTKAQKLLSATWNFSFNRRRLYLNLMKSHMSNVLRTRNALQILRQVTSDYDVLLQISAMFLPTPPSGVLHCSYHDGNTALSRRAEFSYTKASRRVLAESWRDEEHFYRHVDLVFTMSEWLRQSMITDFGVAEDRVVVVGAGPNLSYVDELTHSPPQAKDYGTNMVLFVGVDFEGKGGPTLLDAFRRVRKEIPSAKLRIVGCRPALREPGVDVVGPLDKSDPSQEARLRQLYDESSLFVLPTRYESFGIAFLEAMHHRLPCIGSRICAIPEIVRDGETGFLVLPDDPVTLADRMILLLRDEGLARVMGERGFARAKTYFSWEEVVKKMLAAIGDQIK